MDGVSDMQAEMCVQDTCLPQAAWASSHASRLCLGATSTSLPTYTHHWQSCCPTRIDQPPSIDLTQCERAATTPVLAREHPPLAAMSLCTRRAARPNTLGRR